MHWTPKVARHPAGENYRQTFVVKDGAAAPQLRALLRSFRIEGT